MAWTVEPYKPVVLSGEEYEAFLKMIQNPGEPTEALVDLFRDRPWEKCF
jgi:uncharacterized protein (DUF1778 family)